MKRKPRVNEIRGESGTGRGEERRGEERRERREGGTGGGGGGGGRWAWARGSGREPSNFLKFGLIRPVEDP